MPATRPVVRENPTCRGTRKSTRVEPVQTTRTTATPADQMGRRGFAVYSMFARTIVGATGSGIDATVSGEVIRWSRFSPSMTATANLVVGVQETLRSTQKRVRHLGLGRVRIADMRLRGNQLMTLGQRPSRATRLNREDRPRVSQFHRLCAGMAFAPRRSPWTGPATEVAGWVTAWVECRESLGRQRNPQASRRVIVKRRVRSPGASIGPGSLTCPGGGAG